MHKLGVNTTILYNLDIHEYLQILSNIGFDAFFCGEQCNNDMVFTDYQEAAQKAGIFFESVHAPFDTINDIWLDNGDGDALCERLCSYARLCGKYHVPILVVHLSSGNTPPPISETGMRRFDKLVENAVQAGTTIAFENQRKLGNLAYAFERYENVKNVGFCWDVGHEKCFANGREFMPLFGNRLVYTHIHDNECMPEGDLHRIPFDGTIDYSVTAKHLKNANYHGTLTLEISPKKTPMYAKMSIVDYYRRAYAAACRIRDMVEQ